MFCLVWEALIALIVGAECEIRNARKDPGGVIAKPLTGILGSFVATQSRTGDRLQKRGEAAGFINGESL